MTIRGIVDHHLAVEYANVRVQEIGARNAILRGTMILRDDNGDDRWTGWINAVAIYWVRTLDSALQDRARS